MKTKYNFDTPELSWQKIIGIICGFIDYIQLHIIHVLHFNNYIKICHFILSEVNLGFKLN